MEIRISEKSILKAIIKYLDSIPGCKAEKRYNTPYGGGGKPDITACFHGRRIEIEVKAPGSRLTKLQERELEDWERSGAVCVVAWSVEDVKKAIENIRVW